MCSSALQLTSAVVTCDLATVRHLQRGVGRLQVRVHGRLRRQRLFGPARRDAPAAGRRLVAVRRATARSVPMVRRVGVPNARCFCNPPDGRRQPITTSLPSSNASPFTTYMYRGTCIRTSGSSAIFTIYVCRYHRGVSASLLSSRQCSSTMTSATVSGTTSRRSGGRTEACCCGWITV